MAERRRSIPSPVADDNYFVRSQQPLHSLMLLLPFILAYEVGTFRYAGAMGGRQLAARTWVQQFLELFGAAGDYLPGLAVVVVLLAMHLSQRRKWRLRPGLYVAMACESLALALPLLLFGLLTGSGHATAAFAGPGGAENRPVFDSLQQGVLLSLGAGIYEELVFRLVLIAAVHFIIVDLLGMPPRRGAVAAILVSSCLFAMAHFNRSNPFTSPAFAFYAIAGFYFAMIYLLRGFGIVAATHAFYDVMVVAWGMSHEHR